MKIGELAAVTGTSIETIRYYERENLLPAAPRTASNYRQYEQTHADRLVFIRHCRSLDMALGEIRVLLNYRDSPGQDCDGVNTLLDEHIGHVTQRIAELKALQKQLSALRSECAHTSSTDNCGILKELATDIVPARSRQARAHVHGAHR